MAEVKFSPDNCILQESNGSHRDERCMSQTAVTEMKDACVATSIFILSCSTSSLRIFLGLSHVRHLSTVREHLSSLVQSTVAGDDDVTRQGLTREKWSELYQDGKVHLSYIY